VFKAVQSQTKSDGSSKKSSIITNNNGREGTSVFWASSFGPEKQRSKLPQDKATMGEPSTGLIHQ
jgi:hypothetical protein